MKKAMFFAMLAVITFVAALITVNTGSEWARIVVPVGFAFSLLSFWMKDRGFNSDVVASMMIIGNFGLVYFHAMYGPGIFASM
ncbi:MAG: hypothetical protein AB8F95_01120 [Bacteroidia bacterium]